MKYSKCISSVHSNQQIVDNKLVMKTSGISSMPTFAEKYQDGTYGWGSYSIPYTTGTKSEMISILSGSVVADLLPYLEVND